MAWSSPESWPTRLLSGEPLAILIAFVITISLPLVLHAFLYRASARASTTPSFVLLGPSAAGKTSFSILLQKRSLSPEAGEPEPTRISQIPYTSLLVLPPSVPLGSNRYRSKNDTSLQDAARNPTRYNLIDTPGHGKLRSEEALSLLRDPSIAGIIFVVDAASLDGSDASAQRDAASYLHDVLLALQRRKAGKGGTKSNDDIPVLIAANKQDLFSALPPGAVRDRLETEVESVRSSKNKGLVTVGEEGNEDINEDMLGGGGEDKFSFKLLREEFGIEVEVLGGAVRGEEAGKGVRRWEEWIGGCL